MTRKHRRELDRFGNNCWEAFWVSMRAQLAVMEMQMTGILVDRNRIDCLADKFMQAKTGLAEKIRDHAHWPLLNLESTFEVREWLFGEELNGKVRKDPDVAVRLRPKGAKSLKLTPYMTTDKRPVKWDKVIQDGTVKEKKPSTNKTALAAISQDNEKVRRRLKSTGKIVTLNLGEPVTWLRDYRFVSQVMKSVLRTPEKEEDGTFKTVDINTGDEDEAFYVYPGGLPRAICGDGRVRTRIWPTKETRRWSTTNPPLQNISKRREADYRRILGPLYEYPIRSLIVASPGHLLVEVDYTGAELLGMAIMSGDEQMIEHAQRACLPDNHPNFYDIHSNVTVLCFQLDCPPTKKGLESVKKEHLRVVGRFESI